MAVKLERKDTVKVINNTTGSLSFMGADDRRYFFNQGGSYKLVELSIIEGLYNECEKMITGGYILFDDKRVYEFLEIPEEVYSRLIPLDKIAEFLQKDSSVIEEVLETSPNNIKINVATVAKKTGIDSKKKIKAIKQTTGFNVEEDEE